jgi:hypothetical protein
MGASRELLSDQPHANCRGVCDADDIPEDPGIARRQSVLYLIGELEALLEVGGVTWTAEDRGRIPQRLANLVSVLRRQAGSQAGP